MKAKFFTVCVTMLLLSTASFAKILRVGYNGVALDGVDFSSVQTAQDAATAGDTIQIYGNVSGGTIRKKVVIIGFGYNLDVNTGLQAVGTNNPSNSNFTLSAGSDGTVLSGVSGTFYVGSGDNTHTTISNITFQRCYGSINFYNNQVYNPSSNIKIISCVITGGGMIWNGDADFAVTNLQVYNCIIYSFNLYKSGTTASIINCVMASPSIVGNTQLGLNNASVLVKNCIFGASGAASNINTVFENNFFAETQPATLPPGSNNRWGQTWANLFNRLGGTDDKPSYYGYAEFDEDYYVLKAGTPAVNGGFDGANQPTAVGIYGGEPAYRYKLSGIPAVPAIYKLTAPNVAATSNPYNVTISVRSNN